MIERLYILLVGENLLVLAELWFALLSVAFESGFCLGQRGARPAQARKGIGTILGSVMALPAWRHRRTSADPRATTPRHAHRGAGSYRGPETAAPWLDSRRTIPADLGIGSFTTSAARHHLVGGDAFAALYWRRSPPETDRIEGARYG